MPTTKQVIFVCALVCGLISTVAAQESTTAPKTTLTITANATGERVRITAPSSVVQLHVEVYAVSGEKLFDQEIRGGNVFDWHLQDGQAQRLAPGAYVCVVTAKSVSGRITQKLGAVTVAEKSASVQAGQQPLSLQQTQAIGPVEADSSWTIAGENEPQTPTVIASDGKEGQMIRGRGALTFRIGNFFSGIDTEQMRLTEAGELGIGTSTPQSKLDVAGTIRAERFLVVRPKQSDVNKTTTGTATTDSNDSVQPLIAGTGTQNQIARWTDNAGTLGDSGITENGGNIGIGTTIPQYRLSLVNPTGAGIQAATSASAASGMTMQADGTNNYLWGYGSVPLLFATNGAEKMRITSSGKVGLGTTSPPYHLSVVNSSGAGIQAATSASAASGMTMQADGANNYLWGYGSVPLLFATNGAEKMRITSSGNVGIGTTTPDSKLEVFNGVVTSSGPSGGRFLTRNPNNQSALVQLDWFNDGTHDWPRIRYGGLNEGATNGFLIQGPSDATKLAVLNNGNVGIGTTSPDTTLHVVNGASGIPSSNPNAIATLESNTTGYLQLLTPNASESGVLLGFPSGVTVGGAIIYNNPANADGLQFRTNFNHTRMVIDSSGNVGIGTTAPADKLHVNGILRVQTLGAADTTTALCRNSSNQIATCNSSSLRYKTAIEPFTGGLEIVNRLRPIRFTWKQGGARDLGLGAEEVAKVEPLLTFTNERGEIEGVKYDRLNVALINAIKEQQKEIEALQAQNAALSAGLRSMERIVRKRDVVHR